MEPAMYLTILVFAVGGCHLVTRLLAFAARLRGSSTTQTVSPVRGDWYMFFHCSDLTGKTNAEPKKSDGRRRDRDVFTKKAVQKRQYRQISPR